MDITPAQQVQRALRKTFLTMLLVMIPIAVLGYIMLRMNIRFTHNLNDICSFTRGRIARYHMHHHLEWFEYYAIPLATGVLGSSISAVMLLVTLFVGRTQHKA